jgi:hypothetical protein
VPAVWESLLESDKDKIVTYPFKAVTYPGGMFGIGAIMADEKTKTQVIQGRIWTVNFTAGAEPASCKVVASTATSAVAKVTEVYPDVEVESIWPDQVAQAGLPGWGQGLKKSLEVATILV